jgi:hypothetical protein
MSLKTEIMMRQAVLFLVLILAAALAQAQDAPKRKSGLWEIKWATGRAEGKEGKEARSRSMQMCVDQATDNPLQHLNDAMRQETCKTSKVRRDGDKLTVDAVCSLKKTTATTHAVITGKFDSAYKIESKSTYDPPLRGNTEGSASQEARWLGPCTADQRPGDVVLAGGKKFNINDKAKASTSSEPGAVPGAAAAPGATPGQHFAPRKPGTPVPPK